MGFFVAQYEVKSTKRSMCGKCEPSVAVLLVMARLAWWAYHRIEGE